jgi:hypothetical protein
MSHAKPEEIELAKKILKEALARPIEERLARLKASGIDDKGQLIVDKEEDV